MTDEKPRILIVSSDEQNNTHLQTALQILDCITQIISDKSEIVQVIQWYLPHLVLIDLANDGREAAKIIRTSSLNGSVPILFLTGSSEQGAAAPGIEQESWQAIDVLRKPYFSFELISRCKTLLSLKGYKKELEIAGQVLQSLALAVEARDPTTGNHCDRLFVRVAKLAEFFSLENRDRDALRKGAILHDIGKVGVPDNILLKEGPLTDAEWQIMKQHVVIGESLCRPLKFLNHVLPIIRHHHEHLDGSGYPDGLKGDKIPLITRIFQICDVFDALTNTRTYKQAYSVEESLEIMKEEADRGWWDPKIFEVFCHTINQESIS